MKKILFILTLSTVLPCVGMGRPQPCPEVDIAEVAEQEIIYDSRINWKKAFEEQLLIETIRSVLPEELKAKATADVNARYTHGYIFDDVTPLHCAAKKGDIKAVLILLASGAEANVRDGYKNSPLHYAARKSNIEVALLLIRSGADVNARSFNGDTPLHEAVSKKNIKIAELLLNHNAKVNAYNIRDNTPLHLAARHGDDYTEIAELLIRHGSHIDGIYAKNKIGETPLSCAKSNRSIKMTRLLLSYPR